jgi:hypothetical protein
MVWVGDGQHCDERSSPPPLFSPPQKQDTHTEPDNPQQQQKPTQHPTTTPPQKNTPTHLLAREKMPKSKSVMVSADSADRARTARMLTFSAGSSVPSPSSIKSNSSLSGTRITTFFPSRVKYLATSVAKFKLAAPMLLALLAWFAMSDAARGGNSISSSLCPSASAAAAAL